MTKKEIAHLIKRYHYIIRAVEKKEKSVKIVKSGRKEIIVIDAKILKFVDILKKVYESENDFLIRKFIELNVFEENRNLTVFSKQPMDRSTYFRYKKDFIDKVYHCCIYEGLVVLEEILNEKLI